jgi:predicted transcriptional regulator|tara:strand:- start:145 stop:396 length:252 start_codon:yes stop_codon:yes gene_type:complete
MKLTINKARVLIFLSQTTNDNKYKTAIGKILNINYGYLHNIVGQMEQVGWLRRIRSNQKVYFELTETCPLEEAKELLSKKIRS